MNAHLSGSTDYKAIAEQSMGRMLSIQPQEAVATPNTPTESLKAPNKGDVIEGWRFMGGEPSDKNNWEEIL